MRVAWSEGLEVCILFGGAPYHFSGLFIGQWDFLFACNAKEMIALNAKGVLAFWAKRY